jgi:nucleotide-binding universal stress UspA family protein
MERRIAVATDGSDAALGALRVAQALAERHEAVVEVVSVLEAIPIRSLVSAETIALARRELEEAGLMALERQVAEQLATVGPEAAAWPLSIELGSAAPTIVRVARAKGATLIVLGLGRHALADRWLGTETALRVMRLAHLPVLAVPAGARELPASALAAVDFSEFSRDAIDTALHLLRPRGTLHLAHVFWSATRETPWAGGLDWLESVKKQTRLELEEYAQALETSADVRVPTHYLAGDPGRELLRLAGTLGVEMIVAGSHGAGFFGRILMGSVSRRLVRGATCSVLIAPPRTVPAELEREEERQAVPAVAL